VASRRIIDSYGGTVVVLGTPAEEVFGGKVLMLSAGVFEGLDVAMMVHPGVRNVVITEALACVGLDVVFVGKAAHAAAYPERGINALEAMVLSFNAINSLRQHIRSDARVHGIITYGGDAANVVPERSAASFLIRALDSSYLEELKVKVLNCFKAAALATNSQLEYKWSDIVYAPMKNNLTLAQIFAGNLESLGRRVQSFSRHFGIGSTDMGNVSQAVPAIHPTVAIATPDVLVHSPDFAIAAASEQGNKGLLDAAKAMAMTIVDIVCEPVVLSKIKDEFYGRSSQA
jgi:amidohydrolase